MANTFEDVSKSLGLSLADAASKKAAMEDYNKKATEAGNEYRAAVQKTQELRGQLNDILNQTLPSEEIKKKIG